MARGVDVRHLSGFRLRHRQRLPWLYVPLLLLAAGALCVAAWTVVHGRALERLGEFVIAAVGGLAALIYFLYGQHRDETRLFIDLFRDFNARYDRLNGHLNAIVTRHSQQRCGELTDAERQHLFDYFNLCGEEYLFVLSGYLDAEVWRAWRMGMREFAAVPAIRSLWERELASGSYYGFALSLLDEG